MSRKANIILLIFIVLSTLSVIFMILRRNRGKKDDKNSTKLTEAMYKCNNWTCELSKEGTMNSKDCKETCVDQLNFEYITQEFNAYDYTGKSVDEITPWFNGNLRYLDDGDIVVLFTDYMYLSQEQYELLNKALDKGAVVIIGYDRWQVCGKPYVCGVDNTCFNCIENQNLPECACNMKGLDPNTYTGQCWTIKGLFEQLRYCERKSGKNNLLILDLATSQSPLPIHTHRKMISFYRKQGRISSLFKGSWNISPFDAKSAVKESGIAISGTIDTKFFQYSLQMDIDTLTPFVFFYNKDDEITGQQKIDPKILIVLGAFKIMKGYPQLPIIANINWTGTDCTNEKAYNKGTKLRGTDKNIIIYLGISPPPKDPAIKFQPPKKVENSNGVSDWTVLWPDIEKKMNVINYNNKSIDWSPGSTWAGTLMQLFFDNAIKKSSAVKIALYMGAFGYAPCKDVMNQGDWGWSNCREKGDGWYLHNIPIYCQYILDFLNNSQKGTVKIIDGQFFTTTYDFDPWLLHKLNEMAGTPDYKDKIQVHMFNAGSCADGRVWDCNNKCTITDGCCRNHEKYYLSDDSLLLSSGHPDNGYYLDFNSINDDILIMEAPTFMKYYNNRYNLMWKNQSMSFDVARKGNISSDPKCNNPGISILQNFNNITL